MKTLPVGLWGELSSTQAGPRRDRGPQRRRDRSGSRAGEASRPCARAPAIGGAGGVGVVVRLERHDLVAGLAQREERRGDRLGRARGDEHLGVGIEARARTSAAGAPRSRGAARGCRSRAGTGCGRRGSPRSPPRRSPAGRRCPGTPARGSPRRSASPARTSPRRSSCRSPAAASSGTAPAHWSRRERLLPPFEVHPDETPAVGGRARGTRARRP